MNSYINHFTTDLFPAARNVERDNSSLHHFSILSLAESCSGTGFKNNLPDQYKLIWIKSGNGTAEINGVMHQLNAGSIFCIAPAHKRSLTIASQSEGFYISFSPDFIHNSNLYGIGGSSFEDIDFFAGMHAFKVADEIQPELDAIATKMLREQNKSLNKKIELLKSLLQVFIIYFTRDIKQTDQLTIENRETELVRNFQRLLKKNFTNSKMVSDYAGQLCVSPNYLNRTIKKATGYTASHHIQQKIIQEAKKQASGSCISMKEIAYSLGFDNIAHFSKFFKINSGMNFTEYKKYRQTEAV